MILRIETIEEDYHPRYHFAFQIIADSYDRQWYDVRQWCYEHFGNRSVSDALCFWPCSDKVFFTTIEDAAFFDLVWRDPEDRPPPYPLQR